MFLRAIFQKSIIFGFVTNFCWLGALIFVASSSSISRVTAQALSCGDPGTHARKCNATTTCFNLTDLDSFIENPPFQTRFQEYKTGHPPQCLPNAQYQTEVRNFNSAMVRCGDPGTHGTQASCATGELCARPVDRADEIPSSFSADEKRALQSQMPTTGTCYTPDVFTTLDDQITQFISSLSCPLGRVYDLSTRSCIAPLDTTASENFRITNAVFSSFNPLKMRGSTQANTFLNPSGSLNVSGLIGRSLEFLFPIAGMILFAMLVWSGFAIVSGATDKKAIEAGKSRATAAILGFLLLFAAYWIIQIVEVVFGVRIFR